MSFFFYRKGGETMTHQSIAVVGGDLRAVYLANRFAEAGWAVSTLFLQNSLPFIHGITQHDTPSMLLPHTKAVILPVPALGEALELNTPLWPEKILLKPLLEYIPVGTPVLGGKLGSILKDLEKCGLPAYDLLEREELTVNNAAYTAEGALAVAMQESPRAILGSQCVVVGYGRIGRLLARYLTALGGVVTITARRPEHLAWIRAEGHIPWETARLAEIAANTDILFNTVPHQVVGLEILKRMKKDVLLIDLASNPGGLDRASAQKIGLKTVWALGLPGKWSPQSAGESIASTVESILEERRLSQ